jgi:hypothetical protein
LVKVVRHPSSNFSLSMCHHGNDLDKCEQCYSYIEERGGIDKCLSCGRYVFGDTLTKDQVCRRPCRGAVES